MTKIFIYFFLISFVLSACQPGTNTRPTRATLSSTPESIITSMLVTDTPVPVDLLTSTTIYPSAIISPSITPTTSSTVESSDVIQPIIHVKPGDFYETVLSIPVGKDRIIQYSGGGVGEINGPIAIAILPDETFMIADLVSNRLLQYNKKGELLNDIDLEDLGIKIAADMRINGGEVLLLELGTGPIPQKYWVRRLSPDGTLISSEEIPPDFSIGNGNTLANALTGIAVDCDGKIILESAGNLYRLTDLQTMTRIEDITKGYYCNKKYYIAVISAPAESRKVLVGDMVYKTQLTLDLGGLSFLDVNPDGSFYVIREDVVNFQPIKVDQTVFYIDADGEIQGVARAPISESFYYANRNMAIGPDGELYFLLPRPDSIEIVRLNFYKEIGPLIPEAVPPNLEMVGNGQ